MYKPICKINFIWAKFQFWKYWGMGCGGIFKGLLLVCTCLIITQIASVFTQVSPVGNSHPVAGVFSKTDLSIVA